MEGEEGLEPDVFVDREYIRSGAALADGTPQVVFVNFAGPVICDDAGEDSRINKSFAICGHFKKCLCAGLRQCQPKWDCLRVPCGRQLLPEHRRRGAGQGDCQGRGA